MRIGKNRVSREKIGGIVWTMLSVAAMLLPGALLIFTEHYPPLTAIAALLLPAGFWFVWFSLSRRRGLMLVLTLPTIVLCALQLVLLYLFGGSIVAVDMFTNILTTNSNEAGELLRNLYPAIFMVAVVYGIPLVCAVVSLLRRKTLEPAARRSAMVAGVVLMVAGAVAAMAARRDFSIKNHLFPLNVTYNIGRSVKAWNNARRYEKTSRDFTFGASRRSPHAGREVYVMVVGETARADNWELFGYGRNTNPRLSQIRGVCPLSRMVTQSNVTHKSVPLMLSSVSAEDFPQIYRRKGIMTLFREAGFSTLFISAQSRNKNVTDHFAAEADSTIYFDDMEGMKYDGDMLPILQRAIAADTCDMFVVLHCYGSHYCYNQRYPEEFRRFVPDEEIAVTPDNRESIVNAYDNTVLYTDWFLSRVIETLGADSTLCSAMLYCADHGEDLFDDERCNFLHSSPRTTYYQLHVASVGWFSDRFTELYPAKVAAAKVNCGSVMTTRYIFHTLARMASIESPYVNDSLSLTSHTFDSTSPLYFLGDRYVPESYLDTGLTEGDMEMFASKGIFLGARTSVPKR